MKMKLNFKIYLNFPRPLCRPRMKPGLFRCRLMAEQYCHPRRTIDAKA